MRRFLSPFILFFITTQIAVHTTAQTDDFCTQLDLIQKATKATHFKPKAYNNEMSKGIYALLMEYLDEDQVNFTQAQVDTFSHLENNIDNALRNNDCNLLRTVTKEYKAYITARIAFLKENLIKKQDYTGTDRLISKKYSATTKDDAAENEESDYFQTDADRLESWSKFLRLEILTRISRTQPSLELAQETFENEEHRIRTLLINEELCAMEEFVKDGAAEKAIEEIFLHVYLTYHDPHSAFFNPTEKETYETSLSTDQKTYGFYVSKDSNDEYYIAHLAPGSMAYVQAKLQENDVLLELEVNGIIKDLSCTSADAINNFLADPAHKTILVTVRKKNGSTLKVKLTKTKTAVEENVVRAYLLGDEDKMGYLRIPSFYTDTDKNYGLGIANDVAKEIYRLKQEQVHGLVLDLRGNGGGSLKEAVDLVGLFIDRGPVTQIYMRDEEPDVTQDFNNGAAYKGPLVVLVDVQSASASELFAATIQAYGRGIIVGQPTYGKATMQNIVPLSSKKESLGYIKITRGAFFNIDGSTHQGTGVQPDITLPMLGATRASHEKNEKFYLKLDSIASVLSYNKQKVNLTEVILKGNNRVLSDTFLQTIKMQDEQLESLLNNYPDVLPLDIKSVYTMIENRSTGLNAVTETAAAPLLMVSNIRIQNMLAASDELVAQNNKELLESISKDPHISACYNVGADLKAARLWE